jgi:serine protease Do
MGISFAIPIDVALDVAEQLKKHGKVSRSRIGVSIQDVSKELAASFGLKEAKGSLITSVEKDGPAAAAGVRAGDVVQQINGQVVDSSEDLPRLLGTVRPGSKIELGVWRNRAMHKLSLVTVEMQDEDPRTAERAYKGKQEAAADDVGTTTGLALQAVPPAVLQKLGVKFGLAVRSARGPAMKAGLQQGDIIVGVGGEELQNARQLVQAIQAVKPGEALPLRVLREGAPLFIALKPEKKAP